MIQREKVEHILRANGKRGVHTFELRQAYIANPSERIRELHERGWVISSESERLNGTAYGSRYVKVSEPEVERDVSERRPAIVFGSGPAPAGTDQAGADVPLSLFDGIERGKGQLGFGEEEAA